MVKIDANGTRTKDIDIKDQLVQELVLEKKGRRCSVHVQS